ncbi:hypothetical protein [Neorhizobium sp. P12A]|nr:hypothetical protein [Neorhizobium sp. P12A]
MFSSQRRQDLEANNHQQIGDPVKFGATILSLVNMADPPARLATGSDAYAVLSKAAKSLEANAEEWKGLTLSTDFPN